jgi:tRNA modification GTPase
VNDTIFALATARGRAGVAVIRISGPRAAEVGEGLAGPLPAPRQTALRVLRRTDGGAIDQALVLRFAAGASFTGEEVVELQTHGSTAVVAAILRELSEQPGLRMAEPGEFTRRAFENGQMDLAQVEGLADLIEAETERQREQALRVLSGALGERAEAWRADLLRAAALLEAVIDFADEEVPEDVSEEVAALMTRCESSLAAEIEGTRAAERVRDGFEVAIVGAPNVGKSTLLNALARREAALTSEIAGTTRDVIEVRMDLDGLPVTLVDTAGLRETEDVVERLGVERTRERAEQADLRVFLVLPGEAPGLHPREGDIVVEAKGDLHGAGVSGLTGQGIDTLVSDIVSVLEQRVSGASVATRERHRAAMQRARSFLAEARGKLDDGPDGYDICAEELRGAIRALESLTGRIDVESVLGEIFASFCIGK